MTQVDLFPLWDNFFGPYCIELSCPPRDLRFNKGLISLNAITGRTKFGWLSAFTEEIVFSAPAIEPIDLLDELERRFEVQKRNGGKRRAAVTQFVEEMTRRSREAASVAPGFKDFPVEDLGEGITLESLYPPEELAELRAQGLTDDAILNLTRKQKLELLGIPDHPARMTAQELLNANGIYLKSYEPGERSTTCKECSHTRSRAGKKKKCLSVKIDADGACWHCNHCGWSGPEKGSGSREPKTSNVVQLTNRRANTNANANANTAGNVNPAIGPVSYVYHTADGTPAFRKIRAYDKDGNKFFWIERPNGKGGWIKGTKDKDGNRLVDLSILYHLPKVNEAIALEHTILVVEGEKDANRLWSIGIPATCSALGAADLSK